MGASGITKVFPGGLSQEALAKEFSALHQQSLYEDGHSAYAGGWGTFRGMKVATTVPFASEEAAVKHVLDHSEKWSHALAVRFRRITKVQTKTPTYAGKKRGYVSGCMENYICATVQNREDPAHPGDARYCIWVVVPADQLTVVQQEAVREVGAAYYNANAIVRRLHDQHHGLVEALRLTRDHTAWLATKPDWAALKHAHAELTKAVRAAVKAKKVLDALEAKLAPTLIATEDKDEGEFWLVGGWAAS